MNKPINFEIAKLIKQKGFNDTVTRRYNYLGKLSKYTQFPENYNTEIWGDEISGPTIAEVVMWLYKKHGIWIVVDYDDDSKKNIWFYNFKTKHSEGMEEGFKSPTAAYERAIEYVLKYLI